MPYANPEDKKRSDRLFRLRRINAGLCENCGNRIPKSRKSSRCKACVQKQIQRHKDRGPEWLAYRRDWRLRHKHQMLDAYGGKCVCCGENRHQFLSIDHVHGGGTSHRDSMSSPEAFYKWLRDHNYPKGYRILCYNCHFSATRLGYCVHKPKVTLHKKKLLMSAKGIRDRAHIAKRRLMVLKHYGGQCECCGEHRDAFLQLEHVGGGGKAHHRRVGGGSKLYAWLVRKDFKIKEKLIILCANCNGINRQGSCPHKDERKLAA